MHRDLALGYPHPCHSSFFDYDNYQMDLLRGSVCPAGYKVLAGHSEWYRHTDGRMGGVVGRKLH